MAPSFFYSRHGLHGDMLVYSRRESGKSFTKTRCRITTFIFLLEAFSPREEWLAPSSRLQLERASIPLTDNGSTESWGHVRGGMERRVTLASFSWARDCPVSNVAREVPSCSVDRLTFSGRPPMAGSTVLEWQYFQMEGKTALLLVCSVVGLWCSFVS